MTADLIVCISVLQRRNFTLAFQAAESVGIKSTLVSFSMKHKLSSQQLNTLSKALHSYYSPCNVVLCSQG